MLYLANDGVDFIRKMIVGHIPE